MAISVQEEMLDFLTGIHGNRKNITTRRKKIFDRAFANAFGDMWTHTGEYVPSKDLEECIENGNKDDNIICRYNKTIIREAIKDYIRGDFNDVENKKDKDSFQKWHEDICNKIVNIGQKDTQFDCKVELIKNTKDNIKLVDKRKKENRCIETMSEYEYVNEVIKKSNQIVFAEFAISEIICHAYRDEMKQKERPIETSFSFGQAQKLVNMLLKYLYIYYNCEGISDLNTVVKFFHSPIDSFVLQASLKSSSVKIGEYNIPWSQIYTYEEYEYIQCEVRKGIDEHYSSYKNRTAFEWELSEWPF